MREDNGEENEGERINARDAIYSNSNKMLIFASPLSFLLVIESSLRCNDVIGSRSINSYPSCELT